MATFEILSINGKNVSTMAINSKPVTIMPPTPLTFESTKAFTDNDLMLGASDSITAAFTITCKDASGNTLGSVAFSEALTSSTKVNIITKLKAAGINVDTMKTAGAKFILHDITSWANTSTSIGFTGSTYGCFQLLGNVNKSFAPGYTTWCCNYMFSNNVTIAAIGIMLRVLPQCTAKSMFFNCSQLKSATATDASGHTWHSKLMFDADADIYTYKSAFQNCTSLVDAPALPAAVVKVGAYNLMFSGCTSLTKAPDVLPMPQVDKFCYQSMFSGCTSLVNAPQILAEEFMYGPAITSCGRSMFSGCTSLTYVPDFVNLKKVDSNGMLFMFQNCTSLVDAPALPATTLGTYAYNLMFSGCTSLVNAPALPATTLNRAGTGGCYSSMFNKCTNVKELHFAREVETDPQFLNQEGQPWFGATNATVYFDL